ncbi:MAG: DUF559 domain-containing protein [Bacteroidetes bacterium]|nr:DUF559 domain-containing protein [Bacteroidota bacterium]
MSLLRIDEIFNFEKGVLQSSKCVPGEYDFITASADWKTHNEYTHDCEALIFAAAASGSLGRTHYVNGKFISSDLCFIITPKDPKKLPVDLKFYHILFNELKDEIVRNTKAGTSKEAIGLGSFGKYQLPYFDITTQVEIKNRFVDSEEIKSSLSNELDLQVGLVQQLRQQLLQDAVQGKLLKSSPPLEEEYPKGEVVETQPNQEYPQGEVVNNLNNLPHLKTFRKTLRNNLTPAEAKLWTLLKGKQLHGKKFRRQFSVANYILDFYCPEERLAIELDGQGHFEASQAEYDLERDLFLNHCGIKVLRFENKWVWDNPEGLIDEVRGSFGWKNNYPSVLRTAPLKGEQLKHEDKDRLHFEIEQPETGQALLAKIKAEKQKLIVEKKLKKEKELPPIKPEEIPFEIPENWVWCRLGEITDIQRGSSPRPKGDSRYFSKVATEFNWITISDISDYCQDYVLLETREHLTEEGSKHSRYVDVGEFIIAVSGSTTGKCCITGINGFIYDGLAVAKIINKGLISRFLLNYMISLYTKINNSKSGASFPNINTEYLNNLLIPLPPLSEQSRIVQKLDELMQYCNELEASIKESESQNEKLLQQVLREAFSETAGKREKAAI